MLFSRRIAASVVVAAAALVTAQSETGDGTFYVPGLGACGIYNDASQYIVGVSEALWQSHSGSLCNKAISITYNGLAVQATITDVCPYCGGVGDLNMTPALFERFAPESAGIIYGVEWVFV
ncbi:hypothetical protein FIBSPDRAFT_197872 [Athelia psychrophila]|uniref:RlpA-like protein double-psi beta-barrel domain-containing protein n=1 Tax=Athelia psychrophila TaxID=1759441 RepID=A0A165ZUL2_9AGAM|nr:hypothetical protein FIBSPDRAFT_197872 [Fibularhizoctonia sp. CBS 109695]